MVASVTHFLCEVCGTQYEHRHHAEQCEDAGEPERPAWLKLGEPVPVFLEQQGRRIVTIRSLHVVRRYDIGHHAWAMTCTERVQSGGPGVGPFECAFGGMHDGEPMDLVASHFDPRRSAHFRYVKVDIATYATWRGDMALYGFDPDDPEQQPTAVQEYLAARGSR